MPKVTHLGGIIKSVKVPTTDIVAAERVAAPRLARTEQSRRFAVMGTAILEKLCRSGKLSVASKRTTPYILDTHNGRIAVSVMVSSVSGDPATKHMIVPVTAVSPPPGVVGHVMVCALIGKREKDRDTTRGITVRLAGWATAEEVMRHVKTSARVATCIKIAAVPVPDLHPIQTLRHYLSIKTNNRNNENGVENEKAMSRLRPETPR